VLLAYRLRREPSTPRITVWRRLRGLAWRRSLTVSWALPANALTREQLEWIADEVVQAGGSASSLDG
jgi:hypothetical protein